jgi:hypothetical protein
MMQQLPVGMHAGLSPSTISMYCGGHKTTMGGVGGAVASAAVQGKVLCYTMEVQQALPVLWSRVAQPYALAPAQGALHNAPSAIKSLTSSPSPTSKSARVCPAS